MRDYERRSLFSSAAGHSRPITNAECFEERASVSLNPAPLARRVRWPLLNSTSGRQEKETRRRDGIQSQATNGGASRRTASPASQSAGGWRLCRRLFRFASRSPCARRGHRDLACIPGQSSPANDSWGICRGNGDRGGEEESVLEGGVLFSSS